MGRMGQVACDCGRMTCTRFDRRHQRCQLHRVLSRDLLQHVWWVMTRAELGLV